MAPENRSWGRCGLLLVAITIAMGCGDGNTHAEEPKVDPKVSAEQKAREEARTKLMAEEPKAPYGEAQRRAFRPPAGCGQGPYRFKFAALSAPLGERFSLYVCSPRSIRGDYRVIEDGRTDTETARSFGWGDDKNRCVATEAEVAQGGSQSSETTEPAAPATKPRSKAASKASPTEVPAKELEEADASFTDCPKGTSRYEFIGHSYATSQGPALAKDRGFTVEVWSAVPNDLTGVLFVVEQKGVRPETTPEAWKDYLDRSHAWYEKYRAFLDGEVAAGRSHWVDSTPKASTPPPPQKTEKRPPKPSENAEWIAGYWHLDQKWAWMPGFWRVPQADVDADLTSHAPAPPPSDDKEETRSPQPTARAVWTPGYWQWDRDSYVWVDGAWRIPPSAEQRWTRPRWRRARSGVVFVPGGWSVRIGRSR